MLFRGFRAAALCVCVAYAMGTGLDAVALEACVKPYGGSPMIHVNGKPVSPLTFFGWESSGAGPTEIELTTEWKEYRLTVTSPETADKESGIHFRLGGGEPGTVWVDHIQVYPGEAVAEPDEAFAREGDFEGARADVERDWRMYTTAGASAEWALDDTTAVSGKQSLRVEIKSPGTDHMHIHWYQSGYSVKEGQKYTYSLWMKADKPRTADFMMLHIGEPWTIYTADSAEASPYRQQVQLAGEAGVNIVSFGISMPWPEPGKEPDFRGVDQCITSTLKANPKALLLPRFDMAPPGWWYTQHPDDAMLFDDGQKLSMSMASETWRTEMQEHLRALVRHCESKFGNQILGYHPCGQHTGEWFYERSWEPRLSDFSPAMQAGFRKWVQARYGTVEALRQSWNDPALTFDAVEIPLADQQRVTKLGWFRDPVTERSIIDFFQYKHIAMEEPLEMMARVIKAETQGKKLSCFFYGYLFDMHGIPMGPQGSGHLAMARLLECPDVDIVCSPISYLDRELGGAGCFMSAVDSVRAHGKLWLNEDDTRTYLTPADSGYGRVDSAQGTFWVHDRNFAQLWPRRLAAWYMDLGGIGWLNGKDIWDNIAPLQRFYETHLTEPACWSPEVALIVDENSPNYAAPSRELSSPLVYEMRSQYYRMGAPFGIYLLSDLTAGKVPPAKVYFFANAYQLDAQQREAIARIVQGKTAVWFYGGGFLSDTARDENLSQATGITLRRGQPEPGKVTPDAAQTGMTSGITTPFGNETVLNPLWTVDDPEAEAIGRFASGGIAAAAKHTPEGLRVYIGTLHCPATLLHNILILSDVHVYCDSNDVVLTDGQFLAISATSAGSKHLRFPKTCTVTGALDGQVIAQEVSCLDFDMALGETRMFLLK